jgi:hypothetical protein
MGLCQLQEGRTTLHESAWYGTNEAVEFLIERGVGVEIATSVGHQILRSLWCCSVFDSAFISGLSSSALERYILQQQVDV